jgi:soluble lytic murein transglycosylase
MRIVRGLLLVVALSLVVPAAGHAVEAGSPEQRRAFAAAVAAFARNDDAEALAGFHKLRDSYPALGDYHLSYIGRIHMRAQRYDEAGKALNALLLHYPRSLHAASAALDLGRISLAARDFSRARTHLQRALYLDDGAVQPAAKLELARLTFLTGDAIGAHEQFVEIRREARGTDVGRVAKEYVATLRTQDPSLAPRGRAALAEASLLIAEGDSNTALYVARSVAEGSPDLRVEARLIEADALFGIDESDRAFAVLWQVVESSPRHPQAPAALFKLASKLWNRDRDAAAMRAFERYLQLYPRADKRVDARYAIARIHESARRIDEAKAGYAELVRAAPNHPLAAESRWRLAWIEYRSGDWWKAAEQFAALAERSTGRERDAATYWRARCHQRLGNDDRARQIYAAIAGDRSYYGMWATHRTRQIDGQPVPGLDVRRLATASTLVTPPPPGRPPQGIDVYHWHRFIELDGARLPQLAHAELLAVENAAGSSTTVRRFLFQAYRTLGRYDDALRLMAKLGSEVGLDPTERRRTLYPLAYWDLVRDEGHKRQVDPLLVLGLMRQESLFDPDARSPAHAWGLLQLLPETARRVASSPDLGGVDPSRLTDPQTNVRLGVAYLGGLLDMYGGNPFQAIAAYNGGEAAVDKWKQRWPDAEPDEFVEAISFRETRDYVKKVIGNYIEYSQLYE